MCVFIKSFINHIKSMNCMKHEPNFSPFMINMGPCASADA